MLESLTILSREGVALLPREDPGEDLKGGKFGPKERMM